MKVQCPDCVRQGNKVRVKLNIALRHRLQTFTIKRLRFERVDVRFRKNAHIPVRYPTRARTRVQNARHGVVAQ